MKKNPKVLRCSYTALNAWSRGNYEEAINQLFHLKELDTPQIRAGREFDEAWGKVVKEKEKLPEVFGSHALSNPNTQLRLTAKLTPWLEFTGVIDIYADGSVIEFKSGVAEANQVIESPQTGGYAILCIHNDLEANKIEAYCYNQYLKKPTYAFAWVNKKLLENSANWIETHASEMYNYINEHDLWGLDKRNEIQ